MNDAETPLVSIVIPTYNHGRYLGRALQSVLDQTYTNWEAIVIDNHSTDNTDEVMASFADPRFTYLKIHNNGVIAASRNAGIWAAKGEWIAFLDSDDWWTGDKLQICMQCNDGSVDLVYHGMEVIGNRRSLFKRKNIKAWQVKKPVLTDLLLRGNPIANSSVVVRKALLEKIGGINESEGMVASEDYNTWLRIAQLTDRLVFLPRRLGYYLTHSQNVSKKDMSLPGRYAVAEFLSELNKQQELRLEANFRYTSARFNGMNGNYKVAYEHLRFVVRYGRLTLKVKCILHLFSLILKNAHQWRWSYNDIG